MFQEVTTRILAPRMVLDGCRMDGKVKSPTRTGHQRGMGGRKTEDDGTLESDTHRQLEKLDLSQ